MNHVTRNRQETQYFALYRWFDNIFENRSGETRFNHNTQKLTQKWHVCACRSFLSRECKCSRIDLAFKWRLVCLPSVCSHGSFLGILNKILSDEHCRNVMWTHRSDYPSHDFQVFSMIWTVFLREKKTWKTLPPPKRRNRWLISCTSLSLFCGGFPLSYSLIFWLFLPFFFAVDPFPPFLCGESPISVAFLELCSLSFFYEGRWHHDRKARGPFFRGSILQFFRVLVLLPPPRFVM